MESFAEQIRKYLGEHNISFSQAAKMTGVERTTLNRYANGSRRPNTLEMVTGLADGLQMSQEEKTALCNAYKRMCISEEFGVRDETLLALLDCKCEVQNIPTLEYTIRETYTEESAMELEGEESIIDAVRYVLKDATYAKLHFTPTDYVGAESLKNAFVDMYKIENWEQILCLENQEWKCGEERIQMLLCFFPFLFRDEKATVYYYYRKKKSAITHQVKNQYVLTDKGIVFFDRDLKKGFFSNEKSPCEFYKMMFEEERKKCRIFAESGSEQYQIAKNWQSDIVYKNEDTGVTFICQKEATGMWVINEKKQAASVRENGSMQLLWRYIRGME